jgi:hypothetical protein
MGADDWRKRAVFDMSGTARTTHPIYYLSGELSLAERSKCCDSMAY